MSADVVLLESDAVERQRYEDALRGLGYRVAVASTGAAGRALLAEAAGALLVANLLLDDGPAFELAAAWRASGHPLLALTDAFRGPTSLQLLRDRLGVGTLVEAPLPTDDLVAHVTSLLPVAEDTDPNIRLEEAPDTAETALTGRIPPALDPTRVPVNGTFEEYEIAAVFARLAAERADGALMLQSDAVKKLVYLEAGVPVGIKSNLLQECLGQLLVQEGRLSVEACDSSLEEMRRTNRRQGEVLVANGQLAAEELAEAVKRQFWVKFRQLFTWSTGVYRFKDATIPAAYRDDPLHDPANLIWQALDQVQPFERVRTVLAPVLGSLVQWSGGGLDLSTLQVDADIHPLFEQLDGRCTATEAMGRAPDAARAELLLYALTAFGAVTYVTAVPSSLGV